VKDKIQEILERELKKFDEISRSNEQPLDASEIRALDTLIKAYHSFCNPPETNPSPAPVSEDPASASTEDLLSTLDATN
jgi:hypothetical protein